MHNRNLAISIARRERPDLTAMLSDREILDDPIIDEWIVEQRMRIEHNAPVDRSTWDAYLVHMLHHGLDFRERDATDRDRFSLRHLEPFEGFRWPDGPTWRDVPLFNDP